MGWSSKKANNISPFVDKSMDWVGIIAFSRARLEGANSVAVVVRSGQMGGCGTINVNGDLVGRSDQMEDGVTDFLKVRWVGISNGWDAKMSGSKTSLMGKCG